MDTILDTIKIPDNKIVLFTEFYKSGFEERNKELLDALQRNICCEHIKKIVLFYENSLDEYPDIPFSTKVEIAYTKTRMKFADYFSYYNKNLSGSICIVANSDIYFDDSIKHVSKMSDDEFLCITRWNGNELQCHDEYSQDVWVFKKQIPQKMIECSGFYLGKQQCDNRISFVAMKNGFNLINPCHLVKCHHLHKDPDKITYNKKDNFKNLLYLSTVKPSDKIEYIENNVCSYWGDVSGTRYCGSWYINFCRNEVNDLESNKL